MTTHPESDYRSPFGLALCAALFSLSLALTDAVAAFVSAGRIQLLDAARHGPAIQLAQAEAWDERQHWVGVVQFAAEVASAVLFLMWVYRANRNARALGAEGMAYSPGWSVGWFFVPLANLVVPYLVIQEIWKASSPGRATNWREAPSPPSWPYGGWFLLSEECPVTHRSESCWAN